METIIINQEEITKARKLQKECIDLHLPSPPIVLWNVEIKDNEKTEKKIISKANSYVRNALNLLAINLGMISTSVMSTQIFGDGVVNIRDVNASSIIAHGLYRSATSGQIHIGDGTNLIQEESINHVTLDRSTGWNASGNTSTTFFDDETRKLITIVQNSFTNPGTTNKYIYSISLTTNMSGYNTLMIRDVISPIFVGAGKTAVISYQTEITYPE